MKLRLTHALAVLAVLAILAPLANAAQVYVRNRPFTDVVVIGGESYVPVDSFLRAAGFTWQVANGVVMIREGKGSAPDLSTPARLSFGGRNLEVETTLRGNRVYAPMKTLARGLGFTVTANNATGIVDVVKGHEITDTEKTAAADVAKAQADKVAAAQAAAEARKQAREEAAAKAEAEEEAAAKAETGDTAETADTGEKTEKAEKTEKTEKEEPDVAAATPSPAPSATPSASPSPAPEAPKEANLVVQNEVANSNDYTGVVTVTAVVVNQGDAMAKGVSARYQLIGPDGKTWESATLYGPNLPPDQSWNISRTYKHPAGSSMPRGTLTPKFQLNYQKK